MAAFRRPIRLLLATTLVLLNVGMFPHAVRAATLEISLSANASTLPSGQSFTYTIDYRCAGITGTCDNVTLRSVLPPELSNAAGTVQLLGNPQVTSSRFVSASRTAVFTLTTPLNAGSTGQVQILARFPAGTTPDQTQASNTATMLASNIAPVTSNAVLVTATARMLAYTEKRLLGGGALDNETIYEIALRNPAGSDVGGLNLSSVELRDLLPPARRSSPALQAVTTRAATHSPSVWAIGWSIRRRRAPISM
jgi:hypothetical protein